MWEHLDVHESQRLMVSLEAAEGKKFQFVPRKTLTLSFQPPQRFQCYSLGVRRSQLVREVQSHPCRPEKKVKRIEEEKNVKRGLS